MKKQEIRLLAKASYSAEALEELIEIFQKKSQRNIRYLIGFGIFQLVYLLSVDHFATGLIPLLILFWLLGQQWLISSQIGRFQAIEPQKLEA
ncbi:MAG: hypothetical protein AAFX93_00885 [Verrucomicrobiota bacterium]